MIDPEDKLSIQKQSKLLKVSRSSVYYKPRPLSEDELKLMRAIDALHLEHPFAGSRMLRDFLLRDGVRVGRRHMRTAMRRMGIEAIYRKPNTSKPAQGHKIYPYLLRNVVVTRANQVWSTDISYIPMKRGFVYLVAVIDWFSRRVLNWKLSITMDVSFCLEALDEALKKYGKRRFSTPTRARSSPASTSPGGSRKKASPSAWTAKGAGATTSSSNASGARSNMKRCTCTPTTRLARPEAGSASISSSSIAAARTPVCRPKRQIRYTSTDRRSNWRHNAPRKQAVEMMEIKKRSPHYHRLDEDENSSST